MEGTQGTLINVYKDPYHRVPIFISGSAPRCVLWVGGQAESFFSNHYFQALSKALDGDWAFVQMELASSHIGYGGLDHHRDSDDVDDILARLTTQHEMKEVVLFATSTGVQVVLELLKNGNNVNAITRVILHGAIAPIDSEIFTEVGVAKRTERVEELIAAGRREDSQAMRGFYDITITPARLNSGGFFTLQEALWQPALQDDADTVSKALGHINVPTLIIVGHDSQYKPSAEDIAKVTKTTKTSLGCPEDDSTFIVFKDSCDEARRLLNVDCPRHVELITSFLKAADQKRAEMQAREEERRIEMERQKRLALSALVGE